MLYKVVETRTREVEVPTNWDGIEDEYVWQAADEDGTLWAYTEMPSTARNMWVDGGQSHQIGVLFFEDGVSNWQDTLVQRPLPEPTTFRSQSFATTATLNLWCENNIGRLFRRVRVHGEPLTYRLIKFGLNQYRMLNIETNVVWSFDSVFAGTSFTRAD